MSEFKKFIWMGIGAAFGFGVAKYMESHGVSFKGSKDTLDNMKVDYVDETELSDTADENDEAKELDPIDHKKQAWEAINKASDIIGFKFIKPIGFKDKTTAYRVAALAMWEIDQNTVITVGQLSRLAKEEGVDISDERITMEDYGWTCTDDFSPYYSEPDDAWFITNNCVNKIFTNDGEQITTRS